MAKERSEAGRLRLSSLVPCERPASSVETPASARRAKGRRWLFSGIADHPTESGSSRGAAIDEALLTDPDARIEELA